MVLVAAMFPSSEGDMMVRKKTQRLSHCLLSIILGLFLFSAMNVEAASIFNVPQDYPTIQAAIDAAQEGDTVLVAPGTYVDPIYMDKGVMLESSDGPKVTIIDSKWNWKIVIPNYAFQLQQGRIQGFTLRTGVSILSSSLTIAGNIFDGTGFTGSDVIIDDECSSPIIENNIFRNFRCDTGDKSIVRLGADSDSVSPIVRNNLFFNNNSCVAITFYAISGDGNPQFTNNTIAGCGTGINFYQYYNYYSGNILSENNVIVNCGNGCETNMFSGITWRNNLVYGNNTNYAGIQDQTGINGNISAAPVFLDAANNDYHLYTGSPAIGSAGKDLVSLSSTDLDGNPRVVNGMLDMGPYETNPDRPYVIHNVTVSAGVGGTVTPQGPNRVMEGSGISCTVTPHPGYQLVSLLVDGVNVANPSVVPFTYGLSDIQGDHSITAVFDHYFNYFGVQAGNHLESRVTSRGTTLTTTDDISLDTNLGQDTYLDLEDEGGTQLEGWYEPNSNGLFTPQMNGLGFTFALNPPLPIIELPLAAGKTWAGSSTALLSGVTATFRIAGKVSAKGPVIVTVPAGTFLAWPITYTLTGSTRGRILQSHKFTDYFAPYIGTVYSVDTGATTKLTKFAVAGGTVTTPPPVISGISAASGSPGRLLTIKGFQFGAKQGYTAVRIGNIECDQIVSWSDTEIQFIVPKTAPSGTAAVTVVTDVWTSNDTVKFTVLKLPQATSLNPSSGKHGVSVQIAGIDFGTVTGKVYLGKVRVRVTQWNDIFITFTVPPKIRTGTYSVTVVDSQGYSILPGGFTVVE
jgi:hypothetical protein